jgi:hypothetical protein
MAKYKLKALSVQISGKVYGKSENAIFDTDKQKDIAREIEAAYEAGFLEVIEQEKKVFGKNKNKNKGEGEGEGEGEGKGEGEE